MSSLSISIIVWLSKPSACYCQPPQVKMVFCGMQSQLQFMIVSAVFIVILVLFVGMYHFFVFNTRLSDDSLLRSYSGRTMSLVMFLNILWTYASVVPILWNGLLNSVLHTIITSVLCLILIVHPPFYAVEMNCIIFSAFFCSLWGGIMACFFQPMSKWSLASPSPVLTNIVYHFLIYGGAVAIWPLTLKFFPKFLRRNWLVKVDYQKVEHSPKSKSTLRKILPQKEVTGYTMKLGQTIYIRRFNGYEHPSNATFPLTPHLRSPGTDPPRPPLTSSTERSLSFNRLSRPSILPVTPPISPIQFRYPPLTPTHSLNSLPSVHSTTLPPTDPKACTESIYALYEDNMKDAVERIVKSIRHPNQLQELFAFLQIEELAKDQFTLRMVDQVFRRLITKPRFGTLAKVRVIYALFLGHHLNSQSRMAAQITKSCEFFPNLTEKWIGFIKTKEMEKKIPLISHPKQPTNLALLQESRRRNGTFGFQGINWVVSDEDALATLTSLSNTTQDSTASDKTYLMKFQLEHAQKLVLTAQGHTSMMWMHLGRRNVDCDKVQEHAMKSLQAEKEATNIYIQQLKENPDNSNVLRQFALLLRDISHDNEMATTLLQEADRIEDENEPLLTLNWDDEDEEVFQKMEPKQDLFQQNEFDALKPTKKVVSKHRNQIDIFVNTLETTSASHPKRYYLIYPFVVSALLSVLALTIVSYILSDSDFATSALQTQHIRQSLFITTVSGDIAFFMTCARHFLTLITDPASPSTPQEALAVQVLQQQMNRAIPLFDEYNAFVQQFYQPALSQWLNELSVLYSVPSKISGGILAERSEETVSIRQMLFRSMERAQTFEFNVHKIFDDREGFDQTLVEVQMNFFLPLMEELKDISSITMDSIEDNVIIGCVVQMLLLIFAAFVLFWFATFPICLRIRSVNKLGKEELRVLCLVSPKTAREHQYLLELKQNKDENENEQSESESEVDVRHRKCDDLTELHNNAEKREQEEREADIDEKLKKTKCIVPKSITLALVFGTLLFLIVSSSMFILAFIGIMSLPEMTRLIVLSGYRRPYFNMLLSLSILRLHPISYGLSDPTNDSLIFQTSKYTSSILENTTFLHDPEVLDETVRRCSLFLTRLSSRFFHGSAVDTLTGDEFYDNLNTNGARGRFASIDALNTRQDDCFLENRKGCDEEGRWGDFEGSFTGLLEVIAKVLLKSTQLTYDTKHETQFEDQDITLLVNLTRQDIQDSLRQIGYLLQAELTEITDSFQNVLLILIISVSIAELILALIFFIPLPSRLNEVEFLAGRISKQSKETSKQSYEWTDALQTGVTRMDTVKDMLQMSLIEMLDMVEQNKKVNELEIVQDQLLSLALFMFWDEEELMEQYEYPETVMKAHQKQHATLFKKLLDFVTHHSGRIPSRDETRDFCSTWIRSHINTEDSDFASFLQQEAPASVLAVVPDLDASDLPRSVLQYYRHASIGMEERTRFESVMTRLGLNNDGTDH
ncbi:putative hemerythrin [Blattamonas nauphoetae]|uniref:Hemerythrin n=1 Tax=Blattamonas nauphoetae TaxID=2049346 RepID=A0ABQ9Y3N1_9EUKA|nr:putative hemerythrin [Blattamonas nauphoetae]